MNRRKFIKVVGFGAMAIYLSGCGLSAIKDKNKEDTEENVSNQLVELIDIAYLTFLYY